MGIEQKIDELIAALDRNTAALTNGSSGGATSTEKTEKTTKGAAKGATKKEGPKHSQGEVNAALIALKDKHGKEHAAAIIKDVGGVDKMADIKESEYDAVFDAAEAKMKELDEGGDI